MQTPVAVDETSAYIGDVGGRVTAVELASGEVRWTEELGTPISGAVTLDAGRALVTTLGGRDEPSEIVALDAESGDELWRASAEDASNLVSAPVVADGRVLTLDAIGGVLAFDAEDGRFLWRTEVDQPDRSARSALPPARGGGAGAGLGGRSGVRRRRDRACVRLRRRDRRPAVGSRAERSVSVLAPAPHRRCTSSCPRTPARSTRSIGESGHLVWRVDAGGTFLRGIVGRRRPARRRHGVRGRRGGGVRRRCERTLDRRAVPDHRSTSAGCSRVPRGRAARRVSSPSCSRDRSNDDWARRSLPPPGPMRTRMSARSRETARERRRRPPPRRGLLLRHVGSADGLDAEDADGLHERARGHVVESADRGLAPRLAPWRSGWWSSLSAIRGPSPSSLTSLRPRR